MTVHISASFGTGGGTATWKLRRTCARTRAPPAKTAAARCASIIVWGVPGACPMRDRDVGRGCYIGWNLKGIREAGAGRECRAKDEDIVCDAMRYADRAHAYMVRWRIEAGVA